MIIPIYNNNYNNDNNFLLMLHAITMLKKKSVRNSPIHDGFTNHWRGYTFPGPCREGVCITKPLWNKN